MNIKNLTLFLKQVLIKRNILKLTDLHKFYLETNKAKINDINFLLSKYNHLIDENQIASSEYQVYSQNGEDGVILYLLSQAKISSDIKCLEIGSGGGSSNILNLNLNFGYECVFVDGDNKELSRVKEITRENINNDRKKGDSTYIEMFLTTKNLQELDEKIDLKSVTLCSLDIDGIDYYIFEQLLDYKIPIIVCEYNSFLSTENKYTIPKIDNFSRYEYHKSTLVFGAALDALVFSASKNNYSLVYCENNGVNAFFVNNKYLSDKVVPKTVNEAFKENFKYKNISHKSFLTEEIRSLLVSVDKL